MFIGINRPENSIKFDGIPCVIYWSQIKHYELVDAQIGFIEKDEFDYDNEKNYMYFKDSELF